MYIILLKIREIFVFLFYKENMFTIEIEDGGVAL